MNKTLGIRHEDKYAMERRVAITPSHAKKLIEKGISIQVEKSEKRIFKDSEFETVGANIVNDVTDCDVIFGVKEMPIDYFNKNKTYIFFSHVIKGQPYNMPLLKNMMDHQINLIDYEKVADESGKRLIFFGKFAGLAGMINSLWSFGQRLKAQNIETPFLKINQAFTYNSLEEAKAVISAVGLEIAKNGLPKELPPMVIGYTGYGNVSIGAQEIAALLPIKELSPSEYLSLKNEGDLPNNVIYKVVFKENDLSIRKDGSEFNLMDYYGHPEKYENQFEKYVSGLSILMNCMYWDDRYPRIITKDFLEELFKNETALKVIGDVTCDPDGSIECTHKGTEIEDPVFVYNTETREAKMGFEGQGLLVMAVDILPSELPRESSMTFGNALENYVEEILSCDYSDSFESLKLPNPIKRALILHNGKLTPDFEYLKEFLV